MKECQNCGMPMLKKEDFGNSDPSNFLCCHCFKDKSMGVSKDSDKKQDTVNTGVLSFDNLDVLDEDDRL